MEKKLFRFLGIVLAMLVIGSTFIGCHKTTQNAAGPKRTLTVEVFDRGKPGEAPVDNNYWTKWINANFGKENNCTVKFAPLPRSQEVDKLNVLMAANQAPDINFTYDEPTIYNYVEQGGLTQLDSLVNQYGPNIKSYLGSLLDDGKFNGKLMSIPAKMTITMNQGAFIRKDWLDKLGLSLPTTTDELYNDLLAFKNKNPGGVNGVVPWAYSDGTGIASGLGNAPFGFIKDTSPAQIAKYTLSSAAPSLLVFAMPGFEDCMRYMNKLYHAGLISQNFATDKTGATADADISSGKAGFITSMWDYIYRGSPGDYANLQKNVPGSDLEPVDCFQNASGKYPKLLNAPNGFYIIVPKSSKNADLAVKYLNWMSTTKVLMFLQNGVEGTDYTMVNGIPVSKTPSTLTGDKQQSIGDNIDIGIVCNGPEVGSMEKDQEAISNAYPPYQKDIPLAQKFATTDGFPPFNFTIPSASAAKYATTLNNDYIEYAALLITCNPASFDSTYTQYLAKYMADGAQAMIAENVKNYETQTGQTIS